MDTTEEDITGSLPRLCRLTALLVGVLALALALLAGLYLGLIAAIVLFSIAVIVSLWATYL